MTANIADIKITGVRSDNISRVEGEQNQFVLPFSLSDSPPNEWIEFFEKDWESWKHGAPADSVLIDLEIIEDALAVTVSYSALAADPFDRFNFAKVFRGIQSGVQTANDNYRQFKSRDNEQIFALKTMVDKLTF